MRKEALKLRIMGLTERAIAEKLGVSAGSAHQYIVAELDKISKESVKDRETLRDIERERLSLLFNRWLPIATAEALEVSHEIETNRGMQHIEMPDYIAGTKAGELVLKISARLSALDGLDAPIKQEVSGPAGGPIEHVFTAERQAELTDRTRKLLELIPTRQIEPAPASGAN